MLLCSGVAALASFRAHAEFVPHAATGLTYSDNAVRTSDNKESGAQAAAVAGFHFVDFNPRWNADVQAAATYLRYFNDPSSTTEDTLGYVSAVASASIIPRYVSWELLENYGQVATDPFGGLHPADRQNSNYVTTGPDFTMPLGAVDRLDVQLRYSRVSYSQSDTQNNDRGSVNAALVHRWSPIRTVSLNYYGEQVDFSKSTTFADYKLQSAFVSINSMPRRTRIGFDFGATQVDDGITKNTSTLFGAAFARELGRSSSVQFYARRAFADSADSFRFGQGGGSDQILIDQDVRVIAQPYRETNFSLGYSATLPRSLLTVAPYWVKESYIRDQSLDRRRAGVRADLNYLLTSSLRAGGYVQYEKNTYATPGQDNRDIGIGLGLAERFAQNVELAFRFERYSRRNAATPFDENRGILTLSWAPALRVRAPAATDTLFNRARGTNSQPTDRGIAAPDAPL